MEEKLRFEYEQGKCSMKELCERREISRETGYVWLRRYRSMGSGAWWSEGERGTGIRTRHLRKWSGWIVELRHAHMRWRPRKLKQVLERDEPGRVRPALSTMGELLKREGLVVARKKRLRTAPFSQPLVHADGANRV